MAHRCDSRGAAVHPAACSISSINPRPEAVARAAQASNQTMVESDLKSAVLGHLKPPFLHRTWRRLRDKMVAKKQVTLFVGLADDKAVNCFRLLQRARSGEPSPPPPLCAPPWCACRAGRCALPTPHRGVCRGRSVSGQAAERRQAV